MPSKLADAPLIAHISGYRFTQIDDCDVLQLSLQALCEACEVKGTILLSAEGINVCLAGNDENIQVFIKGFYADPRFDGIVFKKTISNTSPYKRLKVKQKPEIITMGRPDLDPDKKTGKHLSAATLQAWLDEGKSFVLLDTRNTYEVEMGTFEQAVHWNIENFHDFPEALDAALEASSHSLCSQPIVTFCTGGVRCEKATALMLEKGLTDVYQLDGGILQYFEDCGRAHFKGKCFVFDDRERI
jgi:UPF0176 protein